MLEAAGRGHRRSGRHPERHRHRTRRTTSSTGIRAAADENAKGSDAECSVDFKYGMKRDFNDWLASLGAAAPVKIAHGAARVEHRAPARGRDQVRPVAARHLRRDGRRRRPRAATSRIAARTSRSAATNGIDAALKAHHLDALLFPGVSSAGIAARPGYPTVTVPFGSFRCRRARARPRSRRDSTPQPGAVQRELHRERRAASRS